MFYSQDGLKLTERFEGCRLEAYRDSAGVWTIGYGHTSGVTEGQSCTQAQAEAWLFEDIETSESAVSRLVTVPLSQAEFDALVDFTFNVGGGALATSTMLRLINTGDYGGAAREFDRWDRAGGQVVAGLLRRREAEHQEFLG